MEGRVPQNNNMNQGSQNIINRRLPLGLQLTGEPYYVDYLNGRVLFQQQNLTPRDANSDPSLHHVVYQPSPDVKMKAANLCVKFLKIGSWERRSQNLDDLVGKFYFAKKRLVWEIMGSNRLKNKVEIQWGNILAMRAEFGDKNKPGILEIELLQPPSFFQEDDPKPRKHTQWRQISDFTGGCASAFRRHYIEFLPGELHKEFSNLLQKDPRLAELSNKGFPSLDSPFFPTMNMSAGGFQVSPSNAFCHGWQQKQLFLPSLEAYGGQGQLIPTSGLLQEPDLSTSGNQVAHMPRYEVMGGGANNNFSGFGEQVAPNPTIPFQSNHHLAYMEGGTFDNDMNYNVIGKEMSRSEEIAVSSMFPDQTSHLAPAANHGLGIFGEGTNANGWSGVLHPQNYANWSLPAQSQINGNIENAPMYLPSNIPLNPPANGIPDWSMMAMNNASYSPVLPDTNINGNAQNFPSTSMHGSSQHFPGSNIYGNGQHFPGSNIYGNGQTFSYQ